MKMKTISRGREKEDLLEDPLMFSVLCHTHLLEIDNKSNIQKITESVYDCSNIVDIVRSTEYRKIIRYLSRMEKQGLLKSERTRGRGQKTTYTINWEGILKNMFEVMKKSPMYVDISELLNYKKYNTKLVIDYIHLYFHGLMTSPSIILQIVPVTFSSLVFSFLNKVLPMANKNIEALRGFKGERAVFLKFIETLNNFNEQYRPHSAINGIAPEMTNYVALLINRKNISSWDKPLLDIIEKKKNIDNYIFPD